MHTYKDAILKTEEHMCFILVPGWTFNVVPGEPIPSVGAFPLNPGENLKEGHDLGEFIKLYY